MNIIPDYNAVTTDYIQDGVLHVNSKGFTGNVQVESAADLTTLADMHLLAPGTLAHTAGYKNIWELGSDGTWAVMKSEE